MSRTAKLIDLQKKLLAPVEPGEIGMLVSFHYWKRADPSRILQLDHRPDIFVDSGGFSAFSQGATVSLDDYCRWLLRWRSVVTHYVVLDEIGDPRATLRNHLRMEQRGLRPLPAIHVGSSPEEIRRFKARGYDRQCLGGMVPHLGRIAASLRRGGDYDVCRWLEDCHVVAREEGVKLHGFGGTNWPILTHYPWATADSSSWAMFRFGRTGIFDPISKRWSTIQNRDISGIMRHADLFRFYGAEPMDLIRDGGEIRFASITIAVRSWLAGVRTLRDSAGSNIQLFLADPTPSLRDAKATAMILSTPPSPLLR